jgi:hypothetical protein
MMEIIVSREGVRYLSVELRQAENAHVSSALLAIETNNQAGPEVQLIV